MIEKGFSSRKIFIFCLLFSLCLHGLALFFLQNFYSFPVTPYSLGKSFAAQDKLLLPSHREDTPILRLSFHAPSSQRGKEVPIWSAASLSKEKEFFGTFRSPSFLEKKNKESFSPLHFSSKHPETKKNFLPIKSAILLHKKETESPTSLLAKAKQNGSSPKKEENKEKKPAPIQEISQVKTEEVALEKKSPSLQEKPLEKSEGQKNVFLSAPTPEKRASLSTEISPFHFEGSLFVTQRAPMIASKKKGVLLPRKSPLSFRMPSSSDLHILSCSNDFDVDVVYNLREDAEGYLFALTLIPKKSLAFQKVKQNYLFLLDRSHSIGEERFFSTKAALFSALSLLDKEDTFNIIVFDKQSESLFEKNMPVNSFTIRHAKEFLQKQKVAGMFASTHISRPLFEGWQQLMKESGSKAIVYLSSGETLDKTGHKKAISDWTQKNKGAVSFYSIIQKGDKKGAILAYLCSANKGKLYASQTSSGFKRQLRKLIHSIRSPLAQNMEAYVYLMKEGAEVSIYPSLKQIPNLYLDQPFVVIGTTKKLEPFTLFLQGKNKEQWFHVKKEISFQKSRTSSPHLYEEWALQKAYRCYDSYLQDGNRNHLYEAKQYLTPFQLEEAFR
jgi:hypothetical protein